MDLNYEIDSTIKWLGAESSYLSDLRKEIFSLRVNVQSAHIESKTKSIRKISRIFRQSSRSESKVDHYINLVNSSLTSLQSRLIGSTEQKITKLNDKVEIQKIEKIRNELKIGGESLLKETSRYEGVIANLINRIKEKISEKKIDEVKTIIESVLEEINRAETWIRMLIIDLEKVKEFNKEYKGSETDIRYNIERELPGFTKLKERLYTIDRICKRNKFYKISLIDINNRENKVLLINKVLSDKIIEILAKLGVYTTNYLNYNQDHRSYPRPIYRDHHINILEMKKIIELSTKWPKAAQEYLKERVIRNIIFGNSVERNTSYLGINTGKAHKYFSYLKTQNIDRLKYIKIATEGYYSNGDINFALFLCENWYFNFNSYITNRVIDLTGINRYIDQDENYGTEKEIFNLLIRICEESNDFFKLAGLYAYKSDLSDRFKEKAAEAYEKIELWGYAEKLWYKIGNEKRRLYAENENIKKWPSHSRRKKY